MTNRNFVPMVPTDNSLVALAMELGYTIFIDVCSFSAGGSHLRYRDDLLKGVSYYDEDLLQLLSTMIQDDRTSAQPSSQSSVVQDQQENAGMEQPQAQLEHYQELIDQLERTIRDLKRQLDLEHRYLMDTQARGFIPFLKRQPVTPFTQKLLADHDVTFHHQASRWPMNISCSSK